MKYWNVAFDLAKKAAKRGEVPVGAIIVQKDKIIAKAYNKREKNNDILAHAEILAIKKASKFLKTWKLDDCELYVTLKPCSMCEKIIQQSRLKKVYYLIEKPLNKKEFYGTKFEKRTENTLTKEYKILLNNFFKNLRK